MVGIPNHGVLTIGDTLTEGEDIRFVGVPSFAPEILRRVRLPDAMKAKKLREALQQLAEEGVVQVFRPTDGSPALVGVVGPLQLDVLQIRLKDEYGLEILWDMAEFGLGALDFVGRSEGAGQLREREQIQYRGRPRRRSRVPGRQPVPARLCARTGGRHRLP